MKKYLSELKGTPYYDTAKEILQNTRLINTEVSLINIKLASEKFRDIMGEKEFYIYYVNRKIGSEHYFLTFLDYIFDSPGYKGLVTVKTDLDRSTHPEIEFIYDINDIVDGGNEINIINIDDALYSGISQFSLIDETLFELSQNKVFSPNIQLDKRMTYINLNWYVITGFITQKAKDF